MKKYLLNVGYTALKAIPTQIGKMTSLTALFVATTKQWLIYKAFVWYISLSEFIDRDSHTNRPADFFGVFVIDCNNNNNDAMIDP